VLIINTIINSTQSAVKEQSGKTLRSEEDVKER